MWDLPGPGIEPVSLALTGRFLSTVLPGKPLGSYIVSHALYTLLYSAVKAPREIHVSEVTENSAKLHWERPEPPSPYLYNLTVTSAHDQAVVLKQNLTVTDRVIGGLLPGQTYHVTVTCSLRSQVRAIYQGSFSTSKCRVALRTVGTPLCTGYQMGWSREQFRFTGPCPEKQQQGCNEILHILVVPKLIN